MPETGWLMPDTAFCLLSSVFRPPLIFIFIFISLHPLNLLTLQQFNFLNASSTSSQLAVMGADGWSCFSDNTQSFPSPITAE